MNKNIRRRNRFIRHLKKIAMATLAFSLSLSPASAIDPLEATEAAASQIAANEGGKIAAKEVLNNALKIAKSKPSMTAATAVVCISCIPVAGTCASASMCVACGILIAKTLG